MALPPPPPKAFTPPKRRGSSVGEAPPSFVPTTVSPPQPGLAQLVESEPVETTTANPVWQANVDEDSGNTYYFNTETEETTWVNPYEDETMLSVSAPPILDFERPGTPPAAHSSSSNNILLDSPPLPPAPPPPTQAPSLLSPDAPVSFPRALPPVPALPSDAPPKNLEPPPSYSFTATPQRMPPSAISFMDVQVKYRFTSARRLITIQLDELKLTQVILLYVSNVYNIITVYVCYSK